MTNRVLDWRPKFDPRSLTFAFAAQPGCSNLTARSTIRRTKKIWLDQGQEGACTGFGEENVRALTPHSAETNDDEARVVYDEARRQDEWPGEDYDGSSVNGAMKAARLQGKIKSWYWCYSLDELDHALSYHGAVEAGTQWYEGMWEPDENGVLHATGAIVGGHAYAIAGYRNVDGVRYYRIENSWGKEWGDEGGAWISADDMRGLLMKNGELACPAKACEPAS